MGGESSFDVAIVGARVAGSITASLLGDMGYRVLVVDSASFPSDTISTHFFRGGGLVGMLERLGVLGRVLALGCPPLNREYEFGDDPTPTVVGPQDPGTVGHNLSCRRLPLDSLLVERAIAGGAEVRQRTIAREIVVNDAGRVTGLVIEHDGRRESVQADLVVGADGRGSPLARWLEVPTDRREPATRAMYFRYLSDYRGPDGSSDGPEFSIVGDEMVYVFPSDDGIACLAVSVTLEVFETFRRGPEAAFDARVARHPGIVERYRSSTPVSRILASGPKDAVIRRASGPGWALVGDAGLHQDPWTGLGMDNAGVHAGFLAEAIDDWRSGRTSEDEAFMTYRTRRDEHALPGFDFTADVGRDLSRLRSG